MRLAIAGKQWCRHPARVPVLAHHSPCRLFCLLWLLCACDLQPFQTCTLPIF